MGGCSRCCSGCSRFFLVILSFFFMVLGLAVVGGVLWLKIDERVERPLRNAFNDYTPNPYEMYELKIQCRNMALVVFYALIAFGACISVNGLIGMCGSLALNRAANGFYSTVLILLLIVEIAFIVFVAFYKNMILNLVNRYLAIAHQYNLQDVIMIRERFNCCGDGTSNSYNYQCQGMAQNNCRDVFYALVSLLMYAGGGILVVLIIIQLLTLMFSCVLIANHKSHSMNET